MFSQLYQLLTLYTLPIYMLPSFGNLQNFKSLYCDFRLLHDGLESSSFQPNGLLVPITLQDIAIWAALGFDTLEDRQAISVMKMRPNVKCTVSLIHSAPYVKTVLPQKFKLEILRNLRVPVLYYESYTIRVWSGIDSVYTILLTTLRRREFVQIFPPTEHLKYRDIKSFAILLVQTTSEICVQIDGVLPNIDLMRCLNLQKRDDLFAIFLRHETPPKYWGFANYKTQQAGKRFTFIYLFNTE